MPKVAEAIKDAFKIPPLKYGVAIGEALGWGATTPIRMVTGEERWRKAEARKATEEQWRRAVLERLGGPGGEPER